jgi:predicted RNase H-like HicB family nuclease
MKLCYPAYFYPDPGTSKYCVEVPDLPGCYTWGDNLAEAVLMGVEAASTWVLYHLEEGKYIPQPSPVETISIDKDKGGFVNLLALDIGEFAKKFGRQPAKKEIEIPAYLITFADEQHIDISATVNDMLATKFLEAHA